MIDIIRRKPYRIRFSYQHLKGERVERAVRLQDWVEMPLRAEDITSQRGEYQLGHILSKLMQIVPAMKSTIPPDAPPEMPPDPQQPKRIEKFLLGLRFQEFRFWEEDRDLFDIFFYEWLYVMYFNNLYWAWMALQNIHSFLELCCTDSSYCTVHNLAILTTAMSLPLSAGELVPQATPMRVPIRTALTPHEISDTLKQGSLTYSSIHKISSISDFCTASLYEIFSEGYIIKKCPNCGGFFVPLSRSDTIFCDEYAPQDRTRTCKEYGRYMTYLNKNRTDEATKLYKQIYNSKANKVKRCDNPKLREDLEDFIAHAKVWKAEVKAGEAEEGEFIQWMKDMKGKKV